MALHGALARARALVGTRFRPQGRTSEDGLDCIGLVLLAHRLKASGVADNYRLSSPARWTELLGGIEQRFRQRSARTARPGDLVAMLIGGRQPHLGILAPGGMVHADARRGRVVEGPFPQGATAVRYFRRRRTLLDRIGQR